MAEVQGYDYSAGRPGGAALKAAGATFVVRYLQKSTPSGVVTLDADEYRDLIAHGISVALVYEAASASRAARGATAGSADAIWALMQARTVGINIVRAIYFAVDFDADPLTVVPYFSAVRSILGPVTGAYGSYRVIDQLISNGHITYAWQTAAWSHGQLHPRAHLYQRVGGHVIGGITCDQNVALFPDFGQHPRPDEPSQSISSSTDRSDEDDDMYLIYEKDGPRICLWDSGFLRHLVDGATAKDLAEIVKGKRTWTTKEIDNLLEASK